MAHPSPAPPIVLPALTKEKAVVVFLHHIGANGQNWAKRFETMRLPHVRYVFPNAPARTFSVWDNAQTTAWFDVHGYTTVAPVDEKSLFEASDNLHRLLDEIVASGVPSERIVIGGFSLGGCLGLYGGLTYNKPLSGIVVMTSWLADNRDGVQKKFHSANKSTPILQMHTDNDPFIALKFAEMTYNMIKPFNANITFKVFKCKPHWPTVEMFENMKTFIEEHTSFDDTDIVETKSPFDQSENQEM